MGKPLIVSDVGDMGRLLRRHPAGLVVPPDDSRALCEAMITMATDTRRRYDAPVRELAQQFDVTRTAREWLKLIGTQ
jgi:glycosyltransferase involved in cell wall biosynthesis